MKKQILTIITFISFSLIIVIIYNKHNEFDFESCNKQTYHTDTAKIEDIIIRKYGFAVDSFNIIDGKIKRNQTISSLLKKYHVSALEIDKIAKKSKNIFDVRKIRAGNKYTIFCSIDSVQTAQYFVYEHSPVEYIIFDVRDSIQIFKKERTIKNLRKISSGFVKTSLWEAMTENGHNPMIAIELSEIYAWTIDFFGLKKGDSFTVIYDEQYIDTISIGLGKIHCAVFNHLDNDIYAIPFMQDSVESFFDEDGNSLKRSFLKAPLRFRRISSRFSYSRLHPILRIRRPHTGIDYAAPTGTPVHAIGDGKVISVKYTKGAGRMLKIKHNSVYTTGYLHLSRYAKGIRVGSYVRQGQIIGYVGSTGLSTGPHLDFRFWKNKQPVDPLKVKSPPVEPIKEKNKVDFEIVKNETISFLNSERLKSISDL
ncbi:MAG: peptidoglycan DD-metalloendopeptidase family protein [Bacteroidales bacterium]|nr:peptidoglycan DD-metalloendopeptidase family protein [Bacteroidales bacterium]